MPLFLRGRFRQDVKPPSAQLDRTHPLAQGLEAFFPFNGDGQTPQNVAYPAQKWTLQNTAPTFVDTPVGPGVKFDGSSRQAYTFASAAGAGSPRLNMQTDLPVSFACLINFTDFSVLSEIFFAGINAANGDIGGFFTNIGTSGKWGVGYGDGVGSSSTNIRSVLGNTVLTAGTWYVLSASIRGATDMSIYINGIDDGATYSGTGASFAYPPSGNANMSIGYGGSAGVGTKASYGWLGYWSRNLTADEHLLIGKSPAIFDMLRGPVVRANSRTMPLSAATVTGGHPLQAPDWPRWNRELFMAQDDPNGAEILRKWFFGTATTVVTVRIPRASVLNHQNPGVF